jgi:hypothetical protein
MHRVPLAQFEPALENRLEELWGALAVTAGFYAMVARVLDAMAVQLEAGTRDYSPQLA